MTNLLQFVINIRKFHKPNAIFAHKLQSALRLRVTKPHIRVRSVVPKVQVYLQFVSKPGLILAFFINSVDRASR
jgi:hypothetical protein